MFKNKKSQVWGIDLTVASMLFLFGIFVFYIYSINYTGEAKDNFEYLFYDGKLISTNLLSEGHPKSWNSGNVVKIGLLTDNKINQTKLENFYNLTQSDYQKTKILFRTKYDYYFFFDDNISIYSSSVDGIGKPGINKSNIDAENLVKITRFTIYKDKPITAYLYVWE